MVNTWIIKKSTIKNFPNQPQHTVHWAMDYFDFFRRAPENVNNYILKGNDFINSLSGYDRNVAKNDIMKYCVKYKPQSLYDFIVFLHSLQYIEPL